MLVHFILLKVCLITAKCVTIVIWSNNIDHTFHIITNWYNTSLDMICAKVTDVEKKIVTSSCFGRRDKLADIIHFEIKLLLYCCLSFFNPIISTYSLISRMIVTTMIWLQAQQAMLQPQKQDGNIAHQMRHKIVGAVNINY